MKYTLIFSESALRHLDEWKKSGQKKILKKIYNLFKELEEHPYTGTGHVEQLKGDLSGYWSRHITKGSRMIYSIIEEKITVTIVSMKKHYSDK